MRQQPDNYQLRPARTQQLLECAWCGDAVDRTDRCLATLPANVALEAWQDELTLGQATDGFFHFSWRGGQWLAYGTPQGKVRGVYCPSHSRVLPPLV